MTLWQRMMSEATAVGSSKATGNGFSERHGHAGETLVSGSLGQEPQWTHLCKTCGVPCVSEGYCSITCLQAVSLETMIVENDGNGYAEFSSYGILAMSQSQESAVTCQVCGRLIPAGETFCSEKCAVNAISANRIAGNCPSCGKILFAKPIYGCTPGRCSNSSHGG